MTDPLYDLGVSTTEQPVRAIDARTAAIDWRPQQFGAGRPNTVEDPIVEPLWTGLRVLALVDEGAVTIRDLDGDPVDNDYGPVAQELADASRATRLLVDGYLSHQPIQSIAEVAEREIAEPAGPSITQMWFGSLAGRRSRPEPTLPVESIERQPPPADEDVAIVVVDLLWLDNEPLLRVPLLERKRILESVVDESRLVRHGIYVRPPIDSWMGSWRSFGFRRLAFKGANSRYTPGAPNAEWAVADLPAR
jgi:hypothetical protein